MKVKAWGTRGSIAIANPLSVGTGGNTTCFEVMSQCLPDGMKLMLDAGTGLVPAAKHYLRFADGMQVSYCILFTHYHWDHVMGLTMAPPTFINQIPMKMFGPIDAGYGPDKMVNSLFFRPFFPVDDKRFRHKITFKSLVDYDVHVLVIHPIGGVTSFSLDRFNILEQSGSHLPMGKKQGFPVDECLVIRMQQTNHGNANCISYRLEERPTGKVFVFCTDHEDVAVVSVDFRNHLRNADLLVIDGQYCKECYNVTAGFGHSTPFGCIKHAVSSGVKRVGLTHHDPDTTDDFINKVILVEARHALERVKNNKEMLADYKVASVALEPDQIFACRDYEEYEV